MSKCRKCGREYRWDILSNCPGCGSESDNVEDAAGSALKSQHSAVDYVTIAAINRTTHAVRALAIFIIFSVTSSCLGFGLIGVSVSTSAQCYEGSCSSPTFFYAGWLVIAVGLVSALIVSLRELAESRP